MSTVTVATASIPHIMFAELMRDDVRRCGPSVDAWRDYAWNLRVGRTHLVVTVDPIGAGLRNLCGDVFEWLSFDCRYIGRGLARRLCGSVR